ncbi:MAG: class A beta-lactamase [Acidobacteriota bacterium]
MKSRSLLKSRVLCLCLALFAIDSSALAQRRDPALERLEREMARLARVGGGTVGATAIHLETQRRVSINGGERFPMASTFKVPIAVQLFTRIDQGEVRLEDMIEIKQKDLHPGSGTLSDLFNKPGLALSVRNLIELMLLISDNSATDLCLRLAGGAEAVTNRMRSLGIEGINVNRSTAQLISDWIGATDLPPEDEWTPSMFRLKYSAVKPEDRAAAAKRFETDPRDTSAPDAMADLLARIFRKDLLKESSAELLIDILRRCRTGEARLRGLLPEGTEVAHKTGTIGGSANDVGIITLPDSTHVAIAVFVKSSEKDTAARERAIAEIARAVYDFFLFQPK